MGTQGSALSEKLEQRGRRCVPREHCFGDGGTPERRKNFLRRVA
jgi:hypothetical protein